MTELTSLTVTELMEAYQRGETTPLLVVTAYLERIKAENPDLRAYLDIYEAEALAAAKTATEQYQNGTASGSLLGVPIAIKNNILILGKRATAASKMLEQYEATYDATVIARLRAAGAIFIGSTNMDEFAMGGSTENSAFGNTKNPLDRTRVPGGSSGGSAAAVAGRLAPAALGTDTGGSVRQPASYCGLVGFKPTYGAVSRYGLIAMGSSLDQAGPLTQTVEDTELIHSVIAGLDPYEATTIASDTYPAFPEKPRYRFGVPRSFLKDGIDADVLANFEAHLNMLQEAGHEIVDIDLPLFEKGLAAYYIVMPAEVSSNLARYDGIRYGLSTSGESLLDRYEESRGAGFGTEVKRRILLGTYVLSSGYYDAYYRKAEQARTLMRQELSQVFADVDVILTPTAPTPAFTFGEQSDPLAMYRQDIFTVPVNLTGVPALSFPMGTVPRNDVSLPVGVQYIGPHGSDQLLFAIGKAVYDARRPS